MTQLYLHDSSETGPDSEPPPGDVIRLQLLVTVKAVANSAARHGETICVAGISTAPHRPGWLWLYPVGVRELGAPERLRKYDIITIDARPVREDPHRERWRPILHTLRTEHHLKQWKPRQRWLEPYVEHSMCRLDREAREGPRRASLALIRPRDVAGLQIRPHPERPGSDRRRLPAYGERAESLSGHQPAVVPPFRGFYRYRCDERACPGHRQQILDWEFAAMQHRLAGLPDDRLVRALENNYLTRMCGPDREVAFYVGNRAGRSSAFSVLGVYWPPRP